MKRIIILTILAIVLSNCEIKVKEASAQQMYNLEYLTEFVIIKDYNIDGMKYKLFISDGSNSRGNVTVINVTKDSLEVELLKNQINNFK